MVELLGVTLTLFLTGMVLMAVGSHRQSRHVQAQRALKLAVFCVIVHVVLGVILFIPRGAWGLALLIIVMGARELGHAMPALPFTKRICVLAVATMLAALFLLNAWFKSPGAVAFCFLVCAIFDGFCQVIGQWLGRHALMPRISPAKTVEGLMGGVIASVALAGALHGLANLDIAHALMAGAAMAGGAFCGDTAGSWIKRQAGIKDFSTLLPGHGGMVDRFSSFVLGLVFATPWLPAQ